LRATNESEKTNKKSKKQGKDKGKKKEGPTVTNTQTGKTYRENLETGELELIKTSKPEVKDRAAAGRLNHHASEAAQQLPLQETQDPYLDLMSTYLESMLGTKLDQDMINQLSIV